MSNSPHLAVQAPSPIMELDAVVAGSAKATSNIDGPRGMYLVGVQIVRKRTVATACRAGIYARVSEVRNALASYKDRLRVVWAGYVRDGAHAASVPNVRAKKDVSYIMEVWGLAEFNGEGVTALLTFDDQPAGAGYIHDEAPGTGPANLVTVDLGNPVAGAEFATHTVAACTRERVVTFDASLTTSAAAANRRASMIFDDGANRLVRPASIGSQVASSTLEYSFSLYGAKDTGVTNPVNVPLPDMHLGPGFRVSFSTLSMDAGDDWAQGFMLVEKWVMPDA